MDIIHTDAARTWANGFGLFKSIGNVDFFPNGGKDQPGCAHYRASLIVSHLGESYSNSKFSFHRKSYKNYHALPVLP